MSALKIALGLGGAALLYEWYTGGLSSILGTSSIASTATTSGYSDSQLLTGINNIQWNPSLIPSDQLTRIQPQIMSMYANVPINPNTVLAYMTGVGGVGTTVGQVVNGYTWNGTTWNGTGAGLLGLGMIINLPNIFSNLPVGSGFGEQEFSALGGLGIIEDYAGASAAYIDEGPFNEAAGFNGSNDGSVSDFLLAANGVGA